MILAHQHSCSVCEHSWDCLFVNSPKAKVCGALEAARVNKEGPVCLLCLHVEMAKRAAERRGVELVVNWPSVSLPVKEIPDANW